MTTAFQSLFDTTISVQPDAPSASTAPTAKTLSRSRAAAAMSTILWRHAQHLDTAEICHQLVARNILASLAVLGLGSTVCAFWQACALLSGSHLQNAVTAFLK